MKLPEFKVPTMKSSMLSLAGALVFLVGNLISAKQQEDAIREITREEIENMTKAGDDRD